MKTNKKVKYTETTHGGSPAFQHITPIQKLKRSVLSCLLWENEFYEDGKSIYDRICEHSKYVDINHLHNLVYEARNIHNLRHVSLLLLICFINRGEGRKTVASLIEKTINRADEITELLAIYWKDGKKPIPKQMKIGLSKALNKFDEYQFAKYNRPAAIKLRDVLFMVHAKPKDEKQAELFKKIADDTLQTPDTWEVALSSGADKKETFERLLKEGKLGYLALLRNLRNMVESGVDTDLIRTALMARKGADKVYPFRFIAAAKACPRLEPFIDQALMKTISKLPKLTGKTVILVDVSGSMFDKLSQKSDLFRADAAAALASIINTDARVFTFSNTIVEVPPRKGIAGVDTILRSQQHGGTNLSRAIQVINTMPYDRIIVITDEQVTDGRVPDPICDKAYMINVASNKNGVGYGKWKHIDGFSENVIKWIYETENDA